MFEDTSRGLPPHARFLRLRAVSTSDTVTPPEGTHPPESGELSYSSRDWDDECVALFAEGREPPACPACARTGFYGPRVAGKSTRYRECRFCGLHQVVDGPVRQAVPAVHPCATWPEIARAPYVWWLPPDVTGLECPFCGEQVSADQHQVRSPALDDSHPWNRVPQGRDRFYYARFWENWAYTKGRVVL